MVITNQVVAQVDGAAMFAADPKKPIGMINLLNIVFFLYNLKSVYILLPHFNVL